jgi:CyaY protein
MGNADQLSEPDFERLADEELHRLLEALIESGEEIDADLASGVLTIAFDDGTKYIINSHRAARQIWMAAERAAWHFDYHAAQQQWIASQSSDELWTAVRAVLSRKLGSTVSL